MKIRFVVMTLILCLQFMSLYASSEDQYTRDLVMMCKNRVEMIAKKGKSVSKNNQIKMNYFCFVKLLSSGKPCKYNLLKEMKSAEGNKSKVEKVDQKFQACLKNNIMTVSKDVEAYFSKITKKQYAEAGSLMDKLIKENKIDKKKLPFKL